MKNCLNCNSEVSLEELFNCKNITIDNESESVFLKICCPYCTLSIFSSVEYPDDELIKNTIIKEWNDRVEEKKKNSCIKCSGIQNQKNISDWMIKQEGLNQYEYICEESKYGKGCGLSIFVDANNENEALKKIIE
tara:strand:+ start:13827 stop:14231 length:405 start_codon:yes stop_codon:yes gene_type:complete